jgi:hypothetical protein
MDSLPYPEASVVRLEGRTDQRSNSEGVAQGGECYSLCDFCQGGSPLASREYWRCACQGR